MVVKLKVKGGIDRKATKKLEKSFDGNLVRALAFIRGAERRNIKRRKKGKSSSPGASPFTHESQQLRRSILFAEEVKNMRGVVGPSRRLISDIAQTHEFGLRSAPKNARKRRDNWKLSIGGHGPLGEVGKTTPRRRVSIKGGRFKGRRRTVKARTIGDPIIGRIRTAKDLANAKKRARTLRSQIARDAAKGFNYPERPFARPTLEEIRPRIIQFWRASVIT